jgi:hypothetical protein
MRKLHKGRLLILAAIIALIMLIPARAAAFSVDISLSQQENGVSCGELWLNGELLWRLLILPDGAQATLSATAPAKTTSLIPAIVDGMFVINVK